MTEKISFAMHLKPVATRPWRCWTRPRPRVWPLTLAALGCAPGVPKALISLTKVVSVVAHLKSRGRYEIAQVTNPECHEVQLPVVIRQGDFLEGDTAYLLAVGTKVPPILAEKSGWQGLLEESDFVVRSAHFGRNVVSHGLLLPESLVQELAGDSEHLEEVLRLKWPRSVWRKRCFLLDLGFDGSFHGSQCTNSERPTVLGQIMEAMKRCGLLTDVVMSDWVALSRVDAGVSARSFKVSTQPLLPTENMVQILEKELPKSIQVHQATPMPLGIKLNPAQEGVVREYGYYFLADVFEDPSGLQSLESTLKGFCGSHCFANFTELKKLEGLKRKIQRSGELQRWAHRLQSWKRSRRGDASISNISDIPVHRAMREACERSILSIRLEVSESKTSSKMMCIRLRGHGFLYNMVRFMVGSALAASLGHLPRATLEKALAAEVAVDLSEMLAPAMGLVLLGQEVDLPWCQDARAEVYEKLLVDIQKNWRPEGLFGKGVLGGTRVDVVWSLHHMSICGSWK